MSFWSTVRRLKHFLMWLEFPWSIHNHQEWRLHDQQKPWTLELSSLCVTGLHLTPVRHGHHGNCNLKMRDDQNCGLKEVNWPFFLCSLNKDSREMDGSISFCWHPGHTLNFCWLLRIFLLWRKYHWNFWNTGLYQRWTTWGWKPGGGFAILPLHWPEQHPSPGCDPSHDLPVSII